MFTIDKYHYFDYDKNFRGIPEFRVLRGGDIELPAMSFTVDRQHAESGRLEFSFVLEEIFPSILNVYGQLGREPYTFWFKFFYSFQSYRLSPYEESDPDVYFSSKSGVDILHGVAPHYDWNAEDLLPSQGDKEDRPTMFNKNVDYWSVYPICIDFSKILSLRSKIFEISMFLNEVFTINRTCFRFGFSITPLVLNNSPPVPPPPPGTKKKHSVLSKGKAVHTFVSL